MSTNPQEEVYKEFLNYDWSKFSDFQDGLKQILDNYLDSLKEQDPTTTSIPALDQQQLIDQAKSFYYCSHTGNILNLDDYLQWKLHNGDKYDKHQKITEIEEEPAANEVKPSDSSSEPPYSSNYQELVELIVSGKPVPGIKHIPDTVLSDQSSTSQASQRVKPWERATTTQPSN